LLLISFHQISSVKIGKINQASIKSNSSIRQSSNNNCTDCLCDCFNPSLMPSCSGINCFPSNHSCQLLNESSWILESDISINTTSNNFLVIKENISRLCSCYTPQNILNYYGQVNLTEYFNNKKSIRKKYQSYST
jgi:hypothetical protein